MIRVYLYLFVECGVYFLAICMSYFLDKKNPIFSVKNVPSIKRLFLQTIIYIALKYTCFIIKSIRMLYEGFFWKTAMLFLAQGIITIVAESLLISLWAQCFFNYFRKKYISIILCQAQMKLTYQR